jgi:hypothetical protein
MGTVEVLKAAKALISDEVRWTKGGNARDKDGAHVSAKSKNAVCWCMGGALLVIRSNRSSEKLLRQVCGGSIARFNDAPATTHADVMAAFDRAIALAEAISC